MKGFLDLKCVVSMAEQVRTPSPMPSPWKKSGCCLFLQMVEKVQQLYSVVAVGALEPSWLPTTASSWVQSRYNLVLNCLQVVDRPGVWQRGAEDGHPPLLCHRGEGGQVHLLDDIHRGTMRHPIDSYPIYPSASLWRHSSIGQQRKAQSIPIRLSKCTSLMTFMEAGHWLATASQNEPHWFWQIYWMVTNIQVGCFMLSEPGNGSDAGAASTKWAHHHCHHHAVKSENSSDSRDILTHLKLIWNVPSQCDDKCDLGHSSWREVAGG